MSDPFAGRSEITAAEYAAWRDAGSPTALIPPIEETAPDWTTSEKKFMAKVAKFATDHGWRVFHTHNSANSAPGVPDLKMLRRGVLRYAELKVEGKKPTKDQQQWLDELAEVGGNVFVHLWYPEDWISIMDVLK